MAAQIPESDQIKQEYHIQQNEALAAKAGLLGQPR
ncbi:mitochondrial import inner membrane translocase subunit Tim9 isoform b [Daubentonia madagascariensis]|uniref:Mitochondrial import inner membrane translocase subunit Tim9 isoform b n=1 Tax=Daubentonia madagascariensis TaxID=31869 RepID=A0ABD2EUF3_DAUMA